METLESVMTKTNNSIMAMVQQNLCLTTKMTGLRLTIETAATSACNNINDLRTRLIPDLCNALTLLLMVQALHGHLSTLGTVLPTSTVERAPTPTVLAAPSLMSAVDDEPPITVPPVLPASGTSTDGEAPHTGLPTDTLDNYPRHTHRIDSTWYHNTHHWRNDNPAGNPRCPTDLGDGRDQPDNYWQTHTSARPRHENSSCPPLIDTNDDQSIPLLGERITLPRSTDKERQAWQLGISRHNIAGLAARDYHGGTKGVPNHTLSFIHTCSYQSFPTTVTVDNVLPCYGNIQLIHKKGSQGMVQPPYPSIGPLR
jgi:hypothetical protein